MSKSKDIRSFFNVTSLKKGTTVLPSASTSKKKRAVKLPSSDEDEIVGTPKNEKENKSAKKSRKACVISSDDEDDVSTNKRQSPRKINLSKLKPNKTSPQKAVNPNDIFGGSSIKRVARPKIQTTKTAQHDLSVLLDSDEEIEKSLLEACKTPEKDTMETPRRSRNNNTPNKYQKLEGLKSFEHLEKTTLANDKNSPKKEKIVENGISEKKKSSSKTPEKKKSSSKTLEKKKSSSKTPEKKKVTIPIKVETSPRIIKKNKSTPEKIDKSIRVTELPVVKSSPRPKLSSSLKKPKVEEQYSDINPDELRHEKRRLSAILYQKYKNRSGVLNHGCKDVPEGKPNCFLGKIFVITGVLESLEREEAAEIIKKYGGKVTTTLSKKTSYMIVGEDSGLAKIAKADEYKTKQITEDEFLELIGKSLNGSSVNDSLSKRKLQKEEEELEIQQPTLKKPKLSSVKVESEEISNKVKKETSSIYVKTEVSPVQVKKEANPVKVKEEIITKDIKFDANSIKTEKIVDTNMLAWVDKYKPTSIKEIIGQQGNASNCVKLINWLKKWYTNHDGKKKLARPNPWDKNDDGSSYKAALLSGPPGVGKTTTANLVCKELGFDIVEFNASDTRSKRLLQEEVSELLSNKSLYGYFHGDKTAVSNKHVLLMDEVDGMAGNEDRGGIQELISLIKNSSIPIICMCNDRNLQKMRTFTTHCYDLRFSKPRLDQIRGFMMSVLFKEKFKVSPVVLGEIIEATNNDIRQTLNHLSLLSAKNNLGDTSGSSNSAKKDLKMGPWDVVRKVFSLEEHKTMTLYDKCDLFFHDYSLGPLFVQQNYLSVAPNVPKNEVLNRVSMAADSLSLGDLVDKRIRSNMAWSLLPVQGMFSSVMVGEYMEGKITAAINFPGWLGKNSKFNKRKRLAQEVHDHTRMRTSASVGSFRLDYAPIILQSIVRPLKEKGLDGVNEALAVIKEYRLLREDIDSLIELTTWPGKKSIMDGVDSKVKASLTRLYNKEVTPYVYTAMAAIKKKKAEKFNDDENYQIDDAEEVKNISSSEEENDINLDALIKAKKTISKPSTSGTSKQSSSKPKNTTKPRTKKSNN